MSKRKIAGTVADPTLPKTPIVIGGKTFNLCFDLGALAEAETAINAELAAAGEPQRVNLLYALPVQNLSSTRIVFAAALRTFHPEIEFKQACKLVSMADLYDVALKVREAWDAARITEEDPANPPTPGE